MQSQIFTISQILEIPSKATVNVIGLTDGVTTIFNPIAVSSSVAPILINLYEDPDVTSLGTMTLDGICLNRQNPQPNKTIVYTNPTLPVSQTNPPIFTAEGFGTNQMGSSISVHNGNFVLKPNTAYLYSIKNDSNQNATVSVNFSWKEVER